MVAVMVCFTSLTEEEKNESAGNGTKPYSWNEFVHMVSYLMSCVSILCNEVICTQHN